MLHDIDIPPETLLHLAPGVRGQVNAAGHVLVDSPVGTVIDAGPSGFAILLFFSEPATFGDAVDWLLDGTRSPTDFAPAITVIGAMIETGALMRADADGGQPSGWSDPVQHARMLDDVRRTGDYLAAIAAAVRPGDVVVDIGTGSGVLAVAAARAGARHVFAIEATDIAEVAEQVFAANGLQDRITVIPGWSTLIDLPEPADLLVSELIGSEPLEEAILETTLDARLRLLKPNARLIPHGLTLQARPLLIPEAQAAQLAFGSDAVERWRRLHGIDFQPLLDVATTEPVLESTEGEVVATWPPVGPPVVLMTWNLATFDDPAARADVDLVVEAPGTVNAIAVMFRADLHGDITHTLDPWRWPSSSWATAVWVLPDPVHVKGEEALRVHYRRPTYGNPELTCEVVERGET